MKKSFILSLFSLLICFSAYAETIISISGKVVNDKNKAMPKVNVQAVGSAIATVTNGDGEFVLKIPSSSNSKAVKFSYVGFSSEIVAVQDIAAREGKFVIKLQEGIQSIASINVDLNSAVTYMEEVFRRKYENYPKEKNYQTAFYREVIKKRQSFATLTEAVVEIERSGIESIYSDRSAIYKGRSFRDRRFTDTLFVKFQGGVVSALLLDVAKKSDIVFTEDPVDKYNFWFDHSETLDGRRMRVVNFSQRKPDPETMLYRGTLYVDSLTMAIARAEFKLNIEEYEDAVLAFIRRQPSGAQVEVQEASYTASYRFLDGKWHFNYCNTELDLRCQFKKRLFRSNYTITSEMVVTDHNSEPKKIPYALNLRPRDFIFDSAKNFYDENFWENYNIIDHEHNIDVELRRFLRQLKE